MVDTSDEWIIERTGIKERHILKGKGLGTSHMGAEAVRGLLKKTGTAPGDVDLLICATTTPDFVFPSTANLICDMADIRNIGSFDVQAACSGFVYALTIAAQFIETGTYRKIIVVGADKMSAIIDYTDRATCVLFGDGAGAVLVEPNRKLRHHRHADLLRRRRHAASAPEGRRQPHAADGGNRRQAPALRPSGRRRGLQIRRRAHGRSRDRTDAAQPPDQRHGRLAGAASGQQAHHRSDRRAHGAAARAGDGDDPQIRQHHRGHDPAVPVGLREASSKPAIACMLAAFGGGFTWGGIYMTWAYEPR